MAKPGLLKTLSDVFLSSTLSTVKEGAEEIIDQAQHKAVQLQERLVQRLNIAVTMLLAALFFLTALMFYLTEDVALSNAEAFALVGAVLLVIMFWFKYRLMKVELKS